MQSSEKRLWFLVYPIVFASLLSFYRRFKSLRNFPVAYASAVVTVIFGFLFIATSYYVERREIDIGLDLATWSRSTPYAMIVLVGFYLVHNLLVSIGGYWRKLLLDFDAKSTVFRRWANCLTVIVFAASVTWMVFENLHS